MREYRKNWKLKNPDYKYTPSSEQTKQYSKTYYETHKTTRIVYLNAHRKNRVGLATPPWANKQEIAEFYAKCPEGYHVDHVLPLRGKTVSGLHVLENLQYLPAHENLRKSNAVYA